MGIVTPDLCAWTRAISPETPEQTSAFLREWAQSGLVNILGGCCGTTPEHVRLIAEAVEGVPPRAVPERPRAMRLSGLEAFELA